MLRLRHVHIYQTVWTIPERESLRLPSDGFWFHQSQEGVRLLVVLCYGCHSATMSRETMLCSFSAEGVMRTMTTEKLLKGMPVLQTQIDTLLEFDVGQRTAAVWQKVPAPRHMELCCSLPVLRFIPRSWTTASSTLRFCCSSRTWSSSLPPTTTASSTY